MENKVLKRSEVPEEMTWKLQDLFQNEEEWEASLKEVEKLSRELLSLEDGLTKDGKSLYSALCLYEEIALKSSLIRGYAHKVRDVDTTSALGQALLSKSQSFEVVLMEHLSFFVPSLISIEDEALESFYNEEPALEKFRIYLSEARRRKEHFLSPEMEKLLAGSGSLSMLAHNGFSALTNADLRFPEVTDKDGKAHRITNGRYITLMQSEDRDFRKEVFTKFYETYRSFKTTLSALYEGQVNQLMFYAKNRRYSSCLEASLDENHISTAVYDNLIEAVHENFEKLHRYVKLRKELLGLQDLHMYDLFVPVVEDSDKKYTIEEAKEIVLNSLAPLGEDYVAVVRKAFSERWLDVMENEGKRNGAYSSGMYGVHPYILLNFNGTLDNVYTLTHEMGHAMHSYYSNLTQGYLDSSYAIFVAEVASTTNEVLLTEYLLKKATDVKEKANILDHFMNGFKSTLFRQTMFAEFEKRATEFAEKGGGLTEEWLTKLYYELNKTYFGPDMEVDELIAYEWLRIPHFYYDFYVYQYATGFSSAVSIANRILKGGEEVVKSYKEFLKSGCTKDPVSILKIAGVDMSTKKPISEALEVFDRVISEMEELKDKGLKGVL